jgi:hypothetical protein
MRTKKASAHRASRACALAARGCAVLLTACSATEAPGPSVDASAGTAQATIGPSGGSVASPDGVITVSIPPGALDHAVTFTIGATAAPLSGAVGPVFEVGPSGTRFAAPASVAIRYTPAELEGGTPSDLVVATVFGGNWQALAAGLVDPATSTVSGETPHLSPFGLVHAIELVTPDAGTPAEASAGIDASAPADASVPEGSAEGAVDAPGEAETGQGEAGACTVESFPAGTCSSPSQPLCSDLPATVAVSCNDNPGGGGYAATCCPPGDAGDAGGD